MPFRRNRFSVLITHLLAGILTIQPVLATEYRIPLRDLKPTNTMPGVGAGAGDVELDDAPVQLLLSTDTLQFEVQESAAPVSQKVLLTNAGFRPATLSTIAGNDDFAIKHNCPTLLEPSSSCTISVTPTTVLPGTQYSLSLGAAEVDEPVAVQLTTVEPFTGIAPHLQASESPVSLGDMSPGTQASATATLKNMGNAPATLTGIASKDAFSITSDCPAQLAEKASCTITAGFSSYVPKTHSLTLRVGAAELPSTSAIPLTFYAKVNKDPAIVPVLGFSPTSLQFDPLDAGAHALKSAVLTNRGTAPAELTGLASSPDFAVSSDCPSTLEIDASCNLQVGFTALKAGTVPAYDLVVGAQADVRGHLMLQGTVNGTGDAPVPVISPNTLDFTEVLVGQSATKTATLSNPATKPIQVKSLLVDISSDVYQQSNDCGDTLPAQTSCTVTVIFTPNSAGARSGRVRVDSEGASTPLALQGVGQQAKLSVSPTTLRLGALPWPSGTVSRSVSIVNTGNIPLTGLAITNNDPHLAVDYGDCTNTLAASKGCSLLLRYTPGGLGVISSSLQILSDAGTATVSLSGAVVKLTSSPTSLAFEDTEVGQASSNQAVTVTNEGPDDVPLDGVSVAAGDYLQANSCGTSLAAGSSCMVAVRFVPLSPGASKGALSVAAYSTGFVNVPLTGTGLPSWLSLSRTSVTLPGSYISQPSTPIDVTLSNPTRNSVALTGMSITNGPSIFSQSNNCDAVLAAGASCIVTLQMTPTAAAAFEGTWSVVSNIGTYHIALAGQGQNARPAMSTSSLSFGRVDIGQRAVKTVTVTNPGAIAMGLKSIATSPSVFQQENDCGTSIPARGTCTVSVSFNPTGTADSSGELRVTPVAGDWSAAGLTGTGQRMGLSLSATSIQFGNITLPGSTPVRNVTLSNTGNVQVTGLSFKSTDSALAVDSGNCSSKLPSMQSCTVSLKYTPSNTGPFAATLQIASDNAGSPTVDVTGRALSIAVAPSALQYPLTWLNESAPDQSVTITNRGTDDLPLEGLDVVSGRGAFNQSNNCGTTLAAGALCTVTVRFTPTTAGALHGELTAVSYGSSLVRVPLDGVGAEPKLALSSTSVHFASTNVGQTSPTVDVTVSNPTNTSVDITGASIVSGDEEFSQSNNCDTTLTPGASCTVTLQMKPKSTSGRSGIWTLVSSLGDYSIGLSGQGTQPVADISPEPSEGTPTTSDGTSETVTPVSTPDGFTHYAINFLATEYGQASAVRNIKFSNKGTGPLTILGLSLLDGADDFRMTNNCGSVLQPGAYCTLSLQFAPSQSGARTGGVALLSDSGEHYFDLTGKGTAAAGALTAVSTSDFGQVEAGTSVQRSFTFKNTGDASVRNLVTAVSGVGLSLLSNACGTSSAPVTVAPGGVCAITVKYAPTALGTLADAFLESSGTLVNGPVRRALTGSSPARSMAFDATPSADFGTVPVSTDTARTFVLRNTGPFDDSVSVTPTVSGNGFAYAGGTCTSGRSLAANATCTVIVNVKPTVDGQLAGSISARSSKGISASLALSAIAELKTPTLYTWAVPGKLYGSAPFVLTPPTSSSPGTFSFTSDNPAVATISGSTVTITGLGTATFTATQQQSGMYGSATKTATFTVTKGAPTITFSIPAQSYQYNPLQVAPVTLAAKSNSAGVLSYSTTEPKTSLTITDNVVTINRTGTFTIKVTQPETEYFNAGSATATLTVTAPGPAIVVNGRAWALRASSNTTWDNASSSCRQFTVGGTAWRQGTIDELRTLATSGVPERQTFTDAWASGGTYDARPAMNLVDYRTFNWSGDKVYAKGVCTRD
jgi:hypothetical protein